MEEAAQASGRWGPLVVMARRIGRHELIDRGAALTYYSVLSLVPGLLVLFSVIGLFGDQGTVEEVIDIFEDVGPIERRGGCETAARIADQGRRPIGHPARGGADRGPVDGLCLHRLLLQGVGDDLGSRPPAGVARVAAARRAHDGVPDPARARPPDHRAHRPARELDRRRDRHRGGGDRSVQLRQVAGAAGRRHAARGAALPHVAQRRAVRHALAGADAGGRRSPSRRGSSSRSGSRST